MTSEVVFSTYANMDFEQYDQRQASNFQELVRRLRPLEQEPSGTSEDPTLRSFSIPNSDPTGFLELIEAIKSDTIRHAQSLDREFPFWESFYNPLPFFRGGEKCFQVDRLINQFFQKATEHLKASKLYTDYAIFNDPSGEVVTYHFKTEEARKDFRLAIGLDPILGFEDFVKNIKDK